MKQIISTLMALMLMAGLKAQHCATASNSIAPLPAIGAMHFTPDYNHLPCIDSSFAVHDTIYFENYTTLTSGGTSVVINNLTIDSINHLPSGLCWTTNKVSNSFAAGETGVIYISGYTWDYPGQYKLRFIGNLNAGAGGVITFNHADLGTLFGSSFDYYLRIKRPTDTCRAVDTTGINVNYHAAITPGGTSAICYGGSVTLSVNTCSGCSYLWSNGSTSATQSINTAGVYTVTVSNGTHTYTAGPVTTFLDSPLVSSFTLAPDTSQVNTWVVTDHSTGTGITNIAWNWGDGSGYNDSTNIHTYTRQGIYRVCEQITDAAGCRAYSCDSLGQVNIPLPQHPSVQISHVLCNYDTILLTTNACTGCTYLWSNGDNQQSTYVSNTGVYTVTISQGGSSVVATSAAVVRDILANPTFTMTQDTNMSNLFHFVNTTGYVGSIHYLVWQWGDGGYSYDSVGMESHLYTTAGSGTNYTVCLELTDSLGCRTQTCTSTGTITVQLPAVPGIHFYNSTVLCNGHTDYIYADACTYCTYLWSTGDTSRYLRVNGAGPYTVTVTQSGHSAVSLPFTMPVDTVTARFSLVQDSTTAHHWFVVNDCRGNHALSYIWIWGDGTGDSSSSPSHTYANPGYYYICVQVNDGLGCWAQYCDSSTYLYKSESMIGVQVVRSSASGIKDIAGDISLSVYPSPASSSLTIERSSATEQTAAIYDALGRNLRTLMLNAKNTTLDVSDIPDGVYTLSLLKGGSGAVRFVIAR